MSDFRKKEKKSYENSPKVSVIIPVFNVEPFLREALDSVVNQTLQDIEIICVDDCSTDGSLAILREYEQKDSRIKVIAQEVNQREIVAKYTGAMQAKSEYIATLDPDDYYAQDFCETLYNEIIKNNADMVCCNMQHIAENGKIMKGKILRVTSEDACVDFGPSCIDKVNPATTNKIMRKSIFLNSLNFTECNIWRDFYQYWRGFTLEDYKVCLLNQELYFYRKRKTSLIHLKSSYEGKWNSFLRTINLVLKYLVENGRYDLYRNVFWEKIAILAKKINKHTFKYNKALREMKKIAETYSIPQEDLSILDTNRLKVFLIGR